MVDATNFKVLCRDLDSLKSLVKSLFSADIVVHDFPGGKVRFHVLTEGTISIANTGAGTDTILYKDTASLFSVARSALFNATIQNENKDDQALLGFIVLVDHTTTSPNTDVGSIEFMIKFRHRSGGSPTYAQAGYGKKELKLESHVVVEAAAIGTLSYCGPFAVDLANPIHVKRNESTLEYLGASCELWRSTTDRPTFTAHTVVTTYTIKVAAYAVLCDLEVLKNYRSLDELWNQFLK
jgi:hypothetical protein